MTSTDHAAGATHADERGDPHELTGHVEDHGHKPNSFYIKTAVALAIVTGLEVALYYLDIGKLFLPTLMVLMVVKFLTVVSNFMHLKFDNKIFSWLFYSGLGLAVGVYIVALMTFRFFDGG
jgi:cytochrome c oxidase subunit 4